MIFCFSGKLTKANARKSRNEQNDESRKRKGKCKQRAESAMLKQKNVGGRKKTSVNRLVVDYQSKFWNETIVDELTG